MKKHYSNDININVNCYNERSRIEKEMEIIAVSTTIVIYHWLVCLALLL